MAGTSRSRRGLLAVGLAWLCLGVATVATGAGFPNPAPKDLCPVCGMVVSKYPNWIAGVKYQDGHAHYFDGAKDLFKYVFNMPRYAPGHRAQDIAEIVVTEYYELKRIDARKAFYVIGSDVYGPMGHELIPLATRADAEEFMHDHKGKRILTYGQVGKALPENLDNGRFE